MAYTPPLGNAVNFQLSDAAYTPPLGNAVNFQLPSPVNIAVGFVDFAAVVVAVHGTSGGVTGQVFAASIDAEHGIAGQATAIWIITAIGVDLDPIPGDSSAHVAFVTAASGIVSPLGSVAVVIFSPNVSGIVNPTGTVQVSLPLSCAASGFVAPAGMASRSIRFFGTCPGRVGRAGVVAASLRLMGSAQGKHGRIGGAAYALRFSSAVQCSRGNAGSAAFKGLFFSVSAGVSRLPFFATFDGNVAWVSALTGTHSNDALPFEPLLVTVTQRENTVTVTT